MPKKEEVNGTPVLDIEAIKEQLKAELLAEMSAGHEEEKAKIQKEKEELEKKLANQEANLEKQIRQQEKNLKKQLESMKKVSIEIPEDPNNPDDVVSVTWNGITYGIPRGRQFQVPEVIYDTWKLSHERTKEVNKRIRESTQKEIVIS